MTSEQDKEHLLSNNEEQIIEDNNTSGETQPAAQENNNTDNNNNENDNNNEFSVLNKGPRQKHFSTNLSNINMNQSYPPPEYSGVPAPPSQHYSSPPTQNINNNYSQQQHYSVPPQQQQHYSQNYSQQPQQQHYSQNYSQQPQHYSQNYSQQQQQHYSQNYSQQQQQQQQYPPSLISPSHYATPNQQYGQNPFGEPDQYGQDGELPPRKAESEKTQIKELPKRMIRAIIKPNKANYQDLRLSSSWFIVFSLLAIKVVWAIIIESIAYSIVGASGVGYAILATILSTLFFFFVFLGIMHGLSLFIGGNKHNNVHSTVLLQQLCFLYLLYSVPLDFCELFTLIPFFGWVVAVALAIYRIVLLAISIQAVYNVTLGRAIGILLVYIAIFLILFFVFTFTIAPYYGALILRSL